MKNFKHILSKLISILVVNYLVQCLVLLCKKVLTRINNINYVSLWNVSYQKYTTCVWQQNSQLFQRWKSMYTEEFSDK